MSTGPSVFEKDSKIVAATTWFRVYPADETFSDRLVYGVMAGVSLIIDNYMRGGCTAGGEFQMMRKEAFHKIGGFNKTIPVSEDLDIFQRIAKVGRVYFANDLFIYHSGQRTPIPK